jgi:ABC-2 type transport system ATP-binding protein
MASIRTAGLTKDFGDLRAVNEIDLDLPEGGVAGFVGPNGAGKSTTIRMLLGLIQPIRPRVRPKIHESSIKATSIPIIRQPSAAR